MYNNLLPYLLCMICGKAINYGQDFIWLELEEVDYPNAYVHSDVCADQLEVISHDLE